MELDIWLKNTADFLIGLGLPQEYGDIAALSVMYLILTVVVLVLVILLLKRKFRQPAPSKQADVQEATATTASEEVESAQKELGSDGPELAGTEELTPAGDIADITDEPASLYQKVRQGLSKTRSSFVGKIDSLLGTHRQLDQSFIDELEEVLITADFGMKATQDLLQSLSERLKHLDRNEPGQLKTLLMQEIKETLDPKETADLFEIEKKPLVIMVVGVNGVGKTTTIGKLAQQFSEQGKSVVLGAADTFRAAAAEQLQIWGERSGATVIRHAEGSDPGAVAYDAAQAAVARKADVLIVDTAGRLHTKLNLMEELKKIRRILSREVPEAPHETLLVLDATTGQNALVQAKMFKEAVDVSGVALTKLDGTAKGGIVVAIKSQLEIPIRWIGVGEGVHDLRPFNTDEFVEALFAND